MEFETLSWDVDSDHILTLTLNRPDALNAFDLVMARELEQAFRRVREDDAVRAVIVTGAGRSFCAGMDLSAGGNVFGLDESVVPTASDLRDRLTEPPFEDGVRDTGGKVALAIHECDKPVVAAINGAAVGIGATMTLAMDVRMASTKARFGLVFGQLGIVPEACSSFFLPRIVGLQKSLELLYRADILTAGEALEHGILRSVHEPEDLLQEAKALASSFVSGRSAAAVAMTRRLVFAGAGSAHPLDAHRRDSLAMFYSSIGDGKEGVAAFLEKRKPQFTKTVHDVPNLG